jgi:hypothetical protein
MEFGLEVNSNILINNSDENMLSVKNAVSESERRSLPLHDLRPPPPIVPRRHSSSGSTHAAKRLLPPPPLPADDEQNSPLMHGISSDVSESVYVDNFYVKSPYTASDVNTDNSSLAPLSLLSPSSSEATSESIYESVSPRCPAVVAVTTPQWNGHTVNYQTSGSDSASLSCSSLYDNEPLYQIYHQGAVVRDVISQTRHSELDTDNLSTDDYMECVTDILKRSTQRNGSLVAGANTQHTSTLEAALNSGTNSFKRLWCEMPKVKESALLQNMTTEERRLQEAQFEIISSEVSYLKSMTLLVGHFMTNLGLNLDRDKEALMTRDDFNRLFSNARAVRDASAK